MKLDEQILEFVRAYPGKMAKEIANSLGIEKTNVNEVLYGPLKQHVRQDNKYRWYASGDGRVAASHPQQQAGVSETTLGRLCRYYLECLSKDTQGGISEFASSYHAVNYAELGSKYLTGEQDAETLFSEEEPRRLFGAVRREKQRLALYLGFPVLLKHMRSQRTNWEGFLVEPIFLWGFDTDANGTFQLPSPETHLPQLNFKALTSLTGATGVALMDDALALMEDLGLAGAGATVPDLDELVARLQAMRQDWEWCERVNPASLSQRPPLSEIETPGIYNRAIVVLAERSPYTVGLESELESLSKVSEGEYCETALGHWIRANVSDGTTKMPGATLEVVSLNSEQREAVEKGLSQNLTVITGPPGTGKSQVVTALLTNAAWQGMRVLFASKNNKAVDVVEQRVNGLGSRPILLRTGRDEYQTQLAEYLTSLQAASTTQEDEQNYERVRAGLDHFRRELEISDCSINEIVKLRNNLDAQEESIYRLRRTLGPALFANCRHCDLVPLRRTAAELKSVISRAIRIEQPFLTRFLWFAFKGGRYRDLADIANAAKEQARWLGGSFPTIPPSDTSIEDWVRVVRQFEERVAMVHEAWRYFDELSRLSQERTIDELQREYIAKQSELADQSLEFWHYWLRIVPGRLDPEQRRIIGNYVSLLRMVLAARQQNTRAGGDVYRRYQQLFPQVVSILPCWAVTSLAARGRIPLEPGFFDLLIVDEASQCDIASLLPLLYRAKRAVIIGDPMQLRHIASLSVLEDRGLLEKHDLVENHGTWNYSQNSVFDLACSLCQAKNLVSLRDHHRSHADIIGFSNREFYERRLRVATRHDRLIRPWLDSPAVRWLDVRGRSYRPASGSLVNDAEAKAVVVEMRRLVLEQGYRGTIGVVSPFRAQANRIRDLTAQDVDLERALAKADFIADTAHGFQGDERDLILFSTALTTDAPDSSKRFLGKTRNLFNVAITRARAALIIVGDESAAKNGGVQLLSDFALYVAELQLREKERARIRVEDLGPEYPRVSNLADVSEWERILYNALYKANIHTLPQYVEEKYRLDLALVIGTSKLDIEVDGEHHRNPWTGELSRRDLIRNQRLMELGWDVMRFWVYQVRDDIGWCIARVRQWMDAKA